MLVYWNKLGVKSCRESAEFFSDGSSCGPESGLVNGVTGRFGRGRFDVNARAEFSMKMKRLSFGDRVLGYFSGVSGARG